MTPQNYFDFLSNDDSDNINDSSWDNMDADLVNAYLDDASIIQDNSDGCEEDNVSKDDENEFSDGELDIHSLDKDELDNNNGYGQGINFFPF